MSEFVDRITIGGSSKRVKDTTLESKQPSQGGTDVSLVTTGEKYSWNKKPSDVQMNDTSIVDGNGIAKIPKAGSGVFGVVQGAESSTGVGVDSQGRITVFKASTSACKNGTNYIACLTPSHQHEASFYGLAKASGDTTQAESSNDVGVYTDNAKLKIQQMFGLWTPKWSFTATCTEDTANFGVSNVYELQLGDVEINIWEELIIMLYQTDSELGSTIMSNNWGQITIRDQVNGAYLGHGGWLMGTSPVIIKYKRFPNVMFVETGWCNSINTSTPMRAFLRSQDYVDTLRYLYVHSENGVVKAGTRLDAYIHRFI